MNKNIEERIQAFKDFMRTPDGSPVVSSELVEWLVSNGFFHVPASTKYHGAYEGGLFEHSMTVASYLVGLTESCALYWKNPESPYIVGMFHDLCKCDQYRRCLDDPSKWEYSTDMLLKGHGDKSVMLLSQFCTLTEEEIACIRYHMGAFTPKEEWSDYTRAVAMYPNVLWTHHADMLASHVAGV